MHVAANNLVAFSCHEFPFALLNNFVGELPCAFDAFAGKPIFELDVLSFGSAKVAQAFAESAKIGLPNLVCFGETHHTPITTRLIALLSKNTKRPRRYGAARIPTNSPHLQPPTPQTGHRIYIVCPLERLSAFCVCSKNRGQWSCP